LADCFRDKSIPDLILEAGRNDEGLAIAVYFSCFGNIRYVKAVKISKKAVADAEQLSSMGKLTKSQNF
jgi:hypothetical protein